MEETRRLDDRRTGREVAVRRPLATVLSGRQVVELERAARQWADLSTRVAAEETMDGVSAGRPERALYGLLWTAGLWCSLYHVRLGTPVEDVANGLTATGCHRGAVGWESGAWEAREQRVRRGVFAVLRPNDNPVEYLRITKALDPPLWGTRFVLLALMDGLSRNMAEHGLGPWGATARVITEAGWAD
jgi:hypothetical protein